LLHRHLSHWHPISTAPHNQGLELRALDQSSLVAIPFPRRRTNASDWINTDLGSRVYLRPVGWRIWQKAKVAATALFDHALKATILVEKATMSKRKNWIRTIGTTFGLIGAAAWSTAQAQMIAINLQGDAGYSYQQTTLHNDGESAIPSRLHRQIVSYASAESPGAIIIDTPNTYLYFILSGGNAIRYGIGIGRRALPGPELKTSSANRSGRIGSRLRTCDQNGFRLCHGALPQN
jgi:hypothetical protein